MKLILHITLTTLLLACAGCGDATGEAHGGANDNSRAAHINIGLPF